MKQERNKICILLLIAFNSKITNSELLEDFQKNVQDTVQKNETILDILQMSVSEYLNLFCDVGIQFLVPDPLCAGQLEFICKRTDILMQSKLNCKV